MRLVSLDSEQLENFFLSHFSKKETALPPFFFLLDFASHTCSMPRIIGENQSKCENNLEYYIKGNNMTFGGNIAYLTLCTSARVRSARTIRLVGWLVGWLVRLVLKTLAIIQRFCYRFILTIGICTLSLASDLFSRVSPTFTLIG